MNSLIVTAIATALIQADQRVQLRVDTSEAEAVLAVVGKRSAGHSISESDWQELFATEPYRRLKQREADLDRSFSDEEFQQFVLSDALAGRAESLRQTLHAWQARDLKPSARRVLDYLPPQAHINATVYPVIKPRMNSFVYDAGGDAGIFLYLDPEDSAEKFENTVAHELHHVGFASVAGQWEAILADLPVTSRRAVEWMGAFGEGFAMLAAAGGPDTHPHAVSPVEDRFRWDRDMTNFNRDVHTLENFFLDVVEGRLTTEADVRESAMSFFGEQGPWYTVGYRMAVIVERRYGRATLIACMMDPRLLLERYNAAATESNSQGGEPLVLWSARLLQQIGAR